MTTYSTIADTEIDQDSPITQPLMTKFRDNMLAIREGDTTAPNILADALEMLLQNTTGTVNNTTVNGSAITGLEKVDFILASGTVDQFTANPGAGTHTVTLSVQCSNDGGSSWGTAITLATKSRTSGGTLSGSDNTFIFSLANRYTIDFKNGVSILSTAQIPNNTNAMRFTVTNNAVNDRTYIVLFAKVSGRI